MLDRNEISVFDLVWASSSRKNLKLNKPIIIPITSSWLTPWDDKAILLDL